MYGRSAENFLTIREFGAIGNGLSYAIGVAAAKPSKTIVLIDGDGSFLMHAQELDTIRRYGLRILICVLNDGAFGSELHKLRVDSVSEHGAVYGRGNLARIAQGYGLRGTVVTELAQLNDLLNEFNRSTGAELWDIHVSDKIMSPMMRRALGAMPAAGSS